MTTTAPWLGINPAECLKDSDTRHSASWRIPGTVIVVLLALALTGYVSARLGGAVIGRAVARVVAGGIAAMAVTYLIGRLFGTAVGA